MNNTVRKLLQRRVDRLDVMIEELTSELEVHNAAAAQARYLLTRAGTEQRQLLEALGDGE